MVKIPRPLVYVFLYSFFWALMIVTSRFVLKQGISPLVLTAQQNIFAAIFLLPFFIKQASTLRQTSKSSITGAFLAGFIGSGVAILLSQYGLKLSTSINYGFLITTSTIFAVILAHFLLKEPISKRKGLYLLLMFFGAFLLSTKGQTIIPRQGDLLILLAAGFFGLTAVISRLIIKKDINPIIVSFFRVIGGFLIIGPFAQVVMGSVFSFQFLIPVILVGLFQGLLLIFLNKTFAVATASYATMMSMMTPVMVAIIAYPLFGEKLTWVQILGGLAILSGGVLTQVKKAA